MHQAVTHSRIDFLIANAVAADDVQLASTILDKPPARNLFQDVLLLSREHTMASAVIGFRPWRSVLSALVGQFVRRCRDRDDGVKNPRLYERHVRSEQIHPASSA